MWRLRHCVLVGGAALVGAVVVCALNWVETVDMLRKGIVPVMFVASGMTLIVLSRHDWVGRAGMIFVAVWLGLTVWFGLL